MRVQDGTIHDGRLDEPCGSGAELVDSGRTPDAAGNKETGLFAVVAVARVRHNRGTCADAPVFVVDFYFPQREVVDVNRHQLVGVVGVDVGRPAIVLRVGNVQQLVLGLQRVWHKSASDLEPLIDRIENGVTSPRPEVKIDPRGGGGGGGACEHGGFVCRENDAPFFEMSTERRGLERKKGKKAEFGVPKL